MGSSRSWRTEKGPQAIAGAIMMMNEEQMSVLLSVLFEKRRKKARRSAEKEKPLTIRFSGFSVELMRGFEPRTSSLPRMRSTD